MTDTGTLQATATQAMVRKILRQPEHCLSFIQDALDTVGLESTTENIETVENHFFTYLHTLGEAFENMLAGLGNQGSH